MLWYVFSEKYDVMQYMLTATQFSINQIRKKVKCIECHLLDLHFDLNVQIC